MERLWKMVVHTIGVDVCIMYPVGMVCPLRTEDNTALFPVTAYRSFSDGKLIFNGSAAGYEGTNTIAKNGNNYRIYYTKIAAGELSTPNNAWGMIGEPYPFRCVQE